MPTPISTDGMGQSCLASYQYQLDHAALQKGFEKDGFMLHQRKLSQLNTSVKYSRNTHFQKNLSTPRNFWG